MKKVGIMTMQRVVNYGSFLQAYGLRKILLHLGYDVEFIDFEIENSIVEKKKQNFFERVKKNINILNFIKRRLSIKKFKKIYNDKFLKQLNINNTRNYNKDVDCLIIGSDEVFNCLQPYPIGYSKNLFGKNYEHTKVISYAASFGHTEYNGLKKYKIDKEISNMLKKFHSISVRDENSFNIIKKLTGNDSLMHLDPVLVSNINNEVDCKVEFKNYIILYVYPGRLTKEEEKYIKKFAKDNNKQIISIGFYQSIASKNIIVEPLKVFSYFKNADFVITDTFHGTIFSILENTNFCTIVRNSNKNKIISLLKKFNLSSRIIKKVNDIDLMYSNSINFSKTNKLIEIEKNKTIKYLKNNI